MCKCVNIDFGSQENYNQTITVDIPPHMESYKLARLMAYYANSALQEAAEKIKKEKNNENRNQNM